MGKNIKFYFLTIFLLTIAISLTSCSTFDLEFNNFQIIAHRGYWKADNGADNSVASLRAAAHLDVRSIQIAQW